jgi:hypothetical protein
MIRSALLVLGAACLLTGCGGSGKEASPAAGTAAAPSTTTVDRCKGAKSAAVRARRVRRLERDLAVLRRVAGGVQTRTFDGTPALSRAVDRLLLDVASPQVSVFVRSRLISRAAALVAPVCEQCFQALEASRPIASGAKMSCG